MPPRLPRALFQWLSGPIAAGALLLGAEPLSAERVGPPPATLLADRVLVTSQTSLTAEGNVEILYKGTRLRAESITYDRHANRLFIGGPLYLVEGDDAKSVLIAESAELDQDLQNGLIRGARLVLDQQLQLAAAEASRVDGRYTQLYKTVSSSCRVCFAGEEPLWQIRAERIVHDEQEQQIYFEQAQFRLVGVPVAYFPRLRLPDPTLDRATGLLVPSVRTTNRLGTGIRLPYFIVLGEDKDLTLTPYVTVKGARTIEARYRQALSFGRFSVTGAATRDDLTADKTRGLLFADATLDLPRDFTLNFDLETVSDPAYLDDYGYEDKDRLDSELELTRTRRGEYISLSATEIESLRANEDNALIPTSIARGIYQRRFSPDILGGRAELKLQTLNFNRNSDTDIRGRDVGRASVTLDWKRGWTLPGGVVASAQGRIDGDFYEIQQDSTYPRNVSRLTGFSATELRWPLERVTAASRQVLEPVVQLVWSPTDPARVPNEDSRLVELDEANLFSLGRFPGRDAYEQGFRANLGISWTRYDPDGWSMGVTAGRVIRARDLGQFTAASGLDSEVSDWLVTTRLDTATGLSLINRAVFDDGLSFAKNELRLGWQSESVDLTGSYIWLDADAAESRPFDTSELGIDATFDVTRNWFASTELRYDLRDDRATVAGLGLGYRNECITVDLSVVRSYASATNVGATTDFGLSVALNGFGDRSKNRARRRSCME